MGGGCILQLVPLQQCPTQSPLGRAAPKPGGALDGNIGGITRERLPPLRPALATPLQLQPHGRGVPPATEPPATDPGFIPTSAEQGSPPQAQGPRFSQPYSAELSHPACSLPPTGQAPGHGIPNSPTPWGTPPSAGGPRPLPSVGQGSPATRLPPQPPNPAGKGTPQATGAPLLPQPWRQDTPSPGAPRPPSRSPRPAPSRARRSPTPNETSAYCPAPAQADWLPPQEG